MRVTGGEPVRVTFGPRIGSVPDPVPWPAFRTRLLAGGSPLRYNSGPPAAAPDAAGRATLTRND